MLGPGINRSKAATANEKVRVAIIGCNGRGMDHIKGYLSLPNAEIVAICDVDSRAVDKGVAAVAKSQNRRPRGEKDLRKLLEDPEIDAKRFRTTELGISLITQPMIDRLNT